MFSARLIASFWSRVDKSGSCWIYRGERAYGYGRVRLSPSTKRTQAHRFAYLVSRGAVPKGLCVCHKCDNRACVNPEHLFLGTVADNNADMIAKGRMRPGARWDRPLRGHEQAIVRAYKRGATMGKLARKYGVSRTGISLLLRTRI